MVRTGNVVRVMHNPQAHAFRKALDSVTLSMAVHGVTVHEYKPVGRDRGVEYILGTGQDAEVVASWDKDARNAADFKWLSITSLTHAQSALIEAHSSLFANL